jgi:hypothetical protein
MADEGFDALARDTTSIPEAGVDEIVSQLNEEQTPRDPETGKFTPRKADGADDGDTEESEPAPEAKAEGEEDDAAPEEVSGEDEAEEDDPETVIEPPASWTVEAKARWADIPGDLQAVIAERESEQTATFNRQVNETVAQRKAADAEREAAQAERQNSAQFLTQVSAYARTMDPIIAKGMNTDWAALSREVGADEAYAQREEFNQRVNYLQAVEQQLQKIQTDSMKQRKQTEETRLREKMPDYQDTAKLQSFKDQSLPILTEVGYTPQEIDQYWEHIPDHRQALILQRLVKLERQEGERKAILAKKAKSPPPKVQKPKAQQDAKAQETARVAALRKQTEQDPNNYDALTELAQRTIGAR